MNTGDGAVYMAKHVDVGGLYASVLGTVFGGPVHAFAIAAEDGEFTLPELLPV